MEQFTVEEFQRDFDALFERVENGESFKIIAEDGKAVIITRAIYDVTHSGKDWRDFWYNEETICDI
jgi:PHD/YefM family antitoxin component YafN of YafNO toxin-antitoxin module